MNLIGVELDFEDEALRVMARKSMERKTGARGLRAIMESTLMDLMYKTPSDDTIRKCIITKEAVEGTGEPQIVHGGSSCTAGESGKYRQKKPACTQKGHSGNSLMKGFDYK